MTQGDASQKARAVVAREVRRAVSAVIVGSAILLLLLLVAHNVMSSSQKVEHEYHRRAIVMADRLHVILPILRVPEGLELASDSLRLIDPIAFEAAAERAYGSIRTLASDIAALQQRFDGDPAFERASARLSTAIKDIEAMRERYAGDRAAFARALSTTDTYLEVVALQIRRQHEFALSELLARRRTTISVLEIAGALVLAGVILGTTHYVRRSLTAIDEILAIDAQHSEELSESLVARGAALREKETLLKEVYHRVENNLQVVSSLLNMQGREIRDPEALHLLNESANRVRSMALVHEQLYRSRDLGKISCREFLEELAMRLTESYAPSSQSVRLVTRADGLELGVESAIPCALIMNELIANAFTHAFEQGEHGTIEAILEALPGGRARLAVHDDGRGLPPGFSPEASATLGMRIVVTLARQLGGELTCTSDHGTRCELIFQPAPI